MTDQTSPPTPENDYVGPPRQPCPHSSPDDECRACRIERRAHNNAVDALRVPPGSKCRHKGGEADCPATCLVVYGGCFAGPPRLVTSPAGGEG